MSRDQDSDFRRQVDSMNNMLGELRSSITTQDVALAQLRSRLKKVKLRTQRVNEELEDEMAEAVLIEAEIEQLTRMVADSTDKSTTKKQLLHQIISEGNKTTISSNAVDSRKRQLEKEHRLQTTNNAEFLSHLSDNWLKYPRPPHPHS